MKSWAIIGFFALLTLFFGSCPDGAMGGNMAQASSVADWLYQCPIMRPFTAAT